MATKPKGFGNFQDALRKLMTVDKEQLDAKMAADKKAKAKARKRKK
jgi:hypothetical protein